MDLESVYSNQVQGRGSVPRYVAGTSFGPVYERDPSLRNLERSVFGQIKELTKEFEEAPPKKEEAITLRKVSVEDAIKELMELEKNLNDSELPPIF